MFEISSDKIVYANSNEFSETIFYFAQIANARKALKFNEIGIIPIVDNNAKFIVLGLLGIVGIVLIYKCYLLQQQNEKDETYFEKS